MSRYAPKLIDRFAAMINSHERRLKRIEAKVSCIDSGWPLAMLPGVIATPYTSGNPMVEINGEPASGPYQYNAGYTPAAGDNVLVAPVGVGQTYVVLCKLA